MLWVEEFFFCELWVEEIIWINLGYLADQGRVLNEMHMNITSYSYMKLHGREIKKGEEKR